MCIRDSMLSEDVHCTVAREVSSDAAASGSRQQKAAVCGVRHNFQNYTQYGAETKERFCANQNEILPPHPIHTHIKRHFFIYGNSLLVYGPASWTHTKGDTLDIAIVQPAKHPRTSPPGSRVSEHMPLYPSCVRLR